MKKFSFLRSIRTPILAIFALLHFKERALGLVNDNFTSINSKSSSLLAVPKIKVDVWNNVIDIDHLAPLLHDESSRIGLGHKVFSRSSTSAKSSGTNVIEQTLDSILTELKDDSKYVEYWTRREWRSIQAHADIDEYRAKQEQQQSPAIKDNGFRYPRNGHVLYLQVGKNVRGPTCVFPNRRSGGDLLRKMESETTCVGGDDSDAREEKEDNSVELVTVPAVPGRLLRFEGDYLHAVPRPTDLWLLRVVKGSPTFEPEEDWGRSVILFNTWNDEPPLGLPVDERNDKEDSSRGNDQSEKLPPSCNKKDQWSQATLSSSSSSCESSTGLQEDDDHHCQNQPQPLSTKIWLLGDYRRRDYRMQTVKLEASENLREALYQESNVMTTKLKIPS